jgi:hypothetical protein
MTSSRSATAQEWKPLINIQETQPNESKKKSGICKKTEDGVRKLEEEAL